MSSERILRKRNRRNARTLRRGGFKLSLSPFTSAFARTKKNWSEMRSKMPSMSGVWTTVKNKAGKAHEFATSVFKRKKKDSDLQREANLDKAVNKAFKNGENLRQQWVNSYSRKQND